MLELRAAEGTPPRRITHRGNARTARGPRTLRRLRRLGSRHPEWWMLPAAAAAWVFLVARPHPHAHHGAPAPGGADAPGLAAMVVAMMLPLVIADVRHAARFSPWRRRHRAIAAFIAAYLTVWMLGMLGIDAGWRWAASRVESATAAVCVTLAAVLWEIVRAKRHAGSHPHAATLATRAWRTDAECARAGAITGGRCVGACWALMAACVAFAHSLPLMIGIFLVQLGGRYRKWVRAAIASLVTRSVPGKMRSVDGTPIPHPEG